MIAVTDSAILSQSGTEIIEALKWYLGFPIYALSAIGVVVGLRWESEKFTPPKQKLGKKILLWSLAIETAFGITIIIADGAVSQAQKSEIIGLHSQLVDFLTTRKLTPKQKDRIALAIKPFRPVSFVAMTAPSEEAWEFVLDISRALKDDGWDWLPFPANAGYDIWQPMDPNLPPEGVTLSNRIVLTVPPTLQAVADALAAALTDPEIFGMENPAVIVSEKASKMTVIVGTKR
jgi:hypothetical protein